MVYVWAGDAGFGQPQCPQKLNAEGVAQTGQYQVVDIGRWLPHFGQKFSWFTLPQEHVHPPMTLGL